MIPKFHNPHLLLEQTENVSRKEIFSEDAESEYTEDRHLVLTLNHLVQSIVELPESLEAETDREQRPKKKRKVKHVGDRSNEDFAPEFRLISANLPPRTISLKPKPTPKNKYREPEYEDTESQAIVRAERAQAISISGEQILLSSIKRPGPEPELPSRNATHFQASLPVPVPPLLVLESTPQRPHRSTRPPLPKLPPDALRMLLTNTQNAQDKCTACPKIAVHAIRKEPHPTNPTPSNRRRKRRQTKLKASLEAAKERPAAHFWRPDPKWRNKCMGYAMGYPGSAGVCRVGYIRDRMKKGACKEPQRLKGSKYISK